MRESKALYAACALDGIVHQSERANPQGELGLDSAEVGEQRSLAFGLIFLRGSAHITRTGLQYTAKSRFLQAKVCYLPILEYEDGEGLARFLGCADSAVT